jgi:hypothetical protein
MEMGKLQEETVAASAAAPKNTEKMDIEIDVEQLPIEPINLQTTTITEDLKKTTRTKPAPLKKRSLKIKLKN